MASFDVNSLFTNISINETIDIIIINQLFSTSQYFNGFIRHELTQFFKTVVQDTFFVYRKFLWSNRWGGHGLPLGLLLLHSSPVLSEMLHARLIVLLRRLVHLVINGISTDLACVSETMLEFADGNKVVDVDNTGVGLIDIGWGTPLHM